jgi:hypothetical protein
MTFIKDGVLTPEMVMEWPLRNRMALHVEHKIEWFGPLESEEVSARTSETQTETKSAKRGGSKTTPAPAPETSTGEQGSPEGGEKTASEAGTDPAATLGKLQDVANALNGILKLDPAVNIELPEAELSEAVKAASALVGLDDENNVSSTIADEDKGLFEADFPGVWDLMTELGLLAHLAPGE